MQFKGLPCSSNCTESSCNARDQGSVPGLGRSGQSTPVILPGESHGQRSLEGHSPWSCKESDTTEHTCMQCKFIEIMHYFDKYFLESQRLMHMCMLSHFSHVWFSATLYWRILKWVAMPSSRDLPHPGIKPESFMSPALAGRFFTTSATCEAHQRFIQWLKSTNLKVPFQEKIPLEKQGVTIHCGIVNRALPRNLGT